MTSNLRHLQTHRERRAEFEAQRRVVVDALHRAAEEVRRLDAMEAKLRRSNGAGS